MGTLDAAWRTMLDLRRAADKLYSEHDELRCKAAFRYQEGATLSTAAGNKVAADVQCLRADAAVKYALADNLYAKASLLWAEAIVAAFGDDIGVTWLRDGSCGLTNGEIYYRFPDHDPRQAG